MNQHASLPLWFQIADRLNKAIEKGEFAPGDNLPSESDLNRQFGVSRTTARAALDFLENKGLIVRRSGKGSMVLPPRVDQPLKLLSGFSEDMRARGLRPSYRIRSVAQVSASQNAAAALELAPFAPVVAIDRLLLADGYPIATSVASLSQAMIGNDRSPTVAELDGGSLYSWLERCCGVRLVGGDEFIEAANADKATAQALEVRRGAAVLVARRVSRLAGGQPVEYVVMHYRADRYRFHVELVRP